MIAAGALGAVSGLLEVQQRWLDLLISLVFLGAVYLGAGWAAAPIVELIGREISKKRLPGLRILVWIAVLFSLAAAYAAGSTLVQFA